MASFAFSLKKLKFTNHVFDQQLKVNKFTWSLQLREVFGDQEITERSKRRSYPSLGEDLP
jgi:hypothetical protein